MKEITLKKLDQIRSSIQQLELNNEIKLEELLVNSSLLSLTQPIFFDQLSWIINDINQENVKGDVLEVGVWRGATAIYMKALLNFTKSDRNLWLFDLFEEEIDKSRLKHKKDLMSLNHFLSLGEKIFTSLSIVKESFRKFDLLDSKVKFVKGNIFNTFNSYDGGKIAILRLDLDFYEPTMFILEKFYDMINTGGYVIIDDYWVEHFNCKEAVDYFRKKNKITNELVSVGNFIVYWKK